jgi:uncharacterized repeat protein (TIGR03803 family)
MEHLLLKVFTGSDGAGQASLTASGSTLYGTTAYGGNSNTGVVFKVNTDGSGFTVLKSFAGGDGAVSLAPLVVANGTLYGTASAGGSAGYGTVFKLNTDGSGYTVLKHFTGQDGATPQTAVLLVGDTLYGTTVSGGLGGGTVFRVNTDGSGFAVLKNFTASDADNPAAGVVLSGNTLYGTTEYGGTGYGAVFRVNTDGSGYAVLKAFGGADGANPRAALALAGNTLYGTTAYGGVSNSGTIFRLNTDGSGFAVLKGFAGGADGANPYGGLSLSSNLLYGTTTFSGGYGEGLLFNVNTNGQDYTVLWNFSCCTPPMSPQARLALSGDTLYGTAGAIFKVNTDGSGFQCAAPSYGPYAPQLYGALALSGGVLYGSGWDSIPSSTEPGYGAVFSMDASLSHYTELASFPGEVYGCDPCPELCLSGNALYGVKKSGYPDNLSEQGLIFRVNTDGSGREVLWTFATSDGTVPQGGLLLSGATLYGTTSAGGGMGCGTVFSLALLSVEVWPCSQTAESGSSACLQAQAASLVEEGPLVYQWFLGSNALAGAAHSWLELSNVAPANAGNYTVVVTNASLAATSATATLSVIPPVPRRTVPALYLAGDVGSLLHLSCAETLAGATPWQPLDVVTLTNVPQLYLDLSDPVPSQRFYRAWQTNGPSASPTINVSMATEITLAGAPGDKLRIDYINQFGPTDAWVTLDTVTLTNTAQLYFDLTMWRQPTRLYRVVPVP